jgi:putative alpha-1,2-mannosidase
MSAWYMMSTLGFYPVAPASDEYAIGSPAVDHAILNLENGKQFIIDVKDQSGKNVYVKKIELNGKVLNRLFLNYADIAQGGTIVFYMSAKHRK